MKIKILLLIISLIPLTSCFDYKELNNRFIIEGIGIDYIDNEYVVTYEIVNTSKKEDKSMSSITINGKDKILSNAFNNANIKLSKEPTLSHTKVLLISEDLAKKGLEEVLLYIIREPSIPHNIYPIITATPSKDIIENNKNTELISEAIKNMIEKNDHNDSIITHESFISFVSDVINPLKDGYLNYLNIEEDKPIIKSISLFKDDKVITTLNKKESSILEVLTNKSKYYLTEVSCAENKIINIGLYQNNSTKIIPEDNSININTTLNATILEDECNLDFRNPDTINNLLPKVEEKINKELESIYNTLLNYNIDTLGIKDIYYKKTKKKDYNYQTITPSFNTTVHLKRNGLIFEVIPNA